MEKEDVREFTDSEDSIDDIEFFMYNNNSEDYIAEVWDGYAD